MAPYFHTTEPNEALKQFVSCYYFLKSDDPDFSSRHYSFPHTYNALSIYKNGNFETKPSHFVATYSATSSHKIVVQVKQQAPLMVDLSGQIDRATILFKDFGINHFVNEPLSQLMSYQTGQLNSWIEDPKLSSFINSLFNAADTQEKAQIIDQFLLHKFRPVQLSYLEQAVPLLVNFEENVPMGEIAKRFGVSIRSFNRNFKEVLGVSPVEYRRIAKFRQSIANKLRESQFKRLTEIGYESHFYDQSYFNKIYHQLTGSNPKKFFDSIERIGDDRLIFQFIKQ